MGSLDQADVHLLAAFHKQYHTLGWFQLCLGRISTLWASVVHRYDPTMDSEQGASLFIHALWSFTKTMWKHQNVIVHGITIQHKAQQMIQELRQKVRD